MDYAEQPTSSFEWKEVNILQDFTGQNLKYCKSSWHQVSWKNLQ